MELSSEEIRFRGSIGTCSFFAARHPTESCGYNGLPLTPNSISIVGQSKILQTLKHKHLAHFIDAVRCKHERIVIVSENYSRCLLDIPSLIEEPTRVLEMVESILEGLTYLNTHDIIVVNLEPKNIYFDSRGIVKLSNYGFNHMTNYGDYVDFPPFNPQFVAPEILWSGKRKVSRIQDPYGDESYSVILPASPPPFSFSVDIWSLGMILLFIYDACHLTSSSLSHILRLLMSLKDFEGHCFDKLNVSASKIHPHLLPLLKDCLVLQNKNRGVPAEILKKFFGKNVSQTKNSKSSFPTHSLRCQNLSLGFSNETKEPLDHLSLFEIYYCWNLAGGKFETQKFEREKYFLHKLPICNLPKIVLLEGQNFGKMNQRNFLYDSKKCLLNLSDLKEVLSKNSSNTLYPLLLHRNPLKETHTENIPLLIKERDVQYQFTRLLLFKRLLQGYPYTQNLIVSEANKDICPHYRGIIWASLLGISVDVNSVYDSIDKESFTSTDRQIEVDIPRCHQYNAVLASPEGHRKFKRILKAWVISNPDLVYWQGLDSLLAPFLYLHFNDEALAFASLSSFIPKYLFGMFQKDNAPVIQEYLAKFRQLTAFHEPQLSNHLSSIGFIPDLYAIPWILTMFAHVFPLHHIFHLWDKLLLGNSSFPLCIALSILCQLKERLLGSEFNDCILLFSDLPLIDIENVVKNSISLFDKTPKSIIYRKYESHKDLEADENELSIQSVTLNQIKNEALPRLSGNDLLSLLHEFPSKILLVDVRNFEDYRIGTLPSAHNIPWSTALTSEGVFREQEKISRLFIREYKVFVIFGSGSNSHSLEFGEKLLALNYKYLCVLHNGIEIFKKTQILIVPPL